MPTSENFDPGRIQSGGERLFGIRMTLPQDDPMIAVLGDSFETWRWYASATERDAALEQMRSEHRFSRIGDRPTLRYERVERDKPHGPIIRRSAA